MYHFEKAKYLTDIIHEKAYVGSITETIKESARKPMSKCEITDNPIIVGLGN